MKESKRTKQCRFWTFLFTLLHLICLIGPFVYFIPYAFTLTTVAASSKVVLSLAGIVGIILTGISVIVDTVHRASLHRSVMWVLICGIIFCLEAPQISVFVWIMAISSLLDELIFTKLRTYFKTALISNKEIDRRE